MHCKVPSSFWNLVISMLFIACGTSYRIEEDGVYIFRSNEGSGNSKYIIEGADPSSFEEIDCDCSALMAKDKLHVYREDVVINGADASSFISLGQYYFRDKNKAYFFGFFNDVQDCALPLLDPTCLKPLDQYPWATCGNILVYGHTTLELDNTASFTPLNDDYGKTHDFIIYQGHILEGADVSSFEIVNSFKAKDKYRYYEWGKPVSK